MSLQFLLVATDSSQPLPKLIYDEHNPILVPVEQVSGFSEQVGRNTNYIIHPEEILADNFEFLLLGKSDLPTPRVIEEPSSALR